jgi:hypothetical protein
MLPSELRSEHFKGYPPQARMLATENLAALQLLPLSFLPGFLREVIEYDYKFPAERKALEQELATLAALNPPERSERFQSFTRITISPKLEHFDWVNSPAQFVEQLSAHLWTTHQLDAFRAAATDYANRLHSAVPPTPPAIPRLGITVVGRGVDSYSDPLFRKLRPHGAYFNHVNPENGLKLLLDAVATRARAHPVPFGHWYIDGAEPVDHDPALTTVSYAALETVRVALLQKMRSEIDKPGMGPETLRTLMAQMRPSELGMKDSDQVLNRFQLKLLTEGSGTQIFSTSFTQWAAREALRRAQALTLLVRFAPRQRQKPMNELLSTTAENVELDPVGSLIDADFGAYYNWLNQQRLPGAETSAFLVWFEGNRTAVLIGPSVPRGTESNSASDLKQLLTWSL